MNQSLAWLVKLLLTALVLALIVWNLEIGRLARTLASASLTAVAISFVLVFIQAGLAAKRLSIVITTFGRIISLRDAMRVTMEGLFFSQTFVSFLGGDAQRIWNIRKCGLSLNEAASVIAFDRFVGIMINHAVVVVCTCYLVLTIDSTPVRIGLLLIAAGGVGAIALVLAIGFMRGRFERLIPQSLQANRLAQFLFEISTVGHHVFTRGPKVLYAFAVSFLIAGVNSLVFLAVLLGWGVPLPSAIGCALLVPAIQEVAMLPISIAGWGVREATSIFAFASFGVSGEYAFGSSVTFALVTLALGLIGGLVWQFDRREIGTLGTIPVNGDADANKKGFSASPR